MAEIFDNKARLIFMQMDPDDICQIHKAFFDYIQGHHEKSSSLQDYNIPIPMRLNRI